MMALNNQCSKRQTREEDWKPQPCEAATGLKRKSPDSTAASKKTRTWKVVPPARYLQEA